MLLTCTRRLEQAEKEVQRNLLKTLLRSKDRGIPNKALGRLCSLFKIRALQLKLDQEAARFVKELKGLATDMAAEENEKARKVASDARTTIWLLERGGAGTNHE